MLGVLCICRYSVEDLRCSFFMLGPKLPPPPLSRCPEILGPFTLNIYMKTIIIFRDRVVDPKQGERLPSALSEQHKCGIDGKPYHKPRIFAQVPFSVDAVVLEIHAYRVSALGLPNMGLSVMVAWPRTSGR